MSAQATPPDWSNLKVLHKNTLPPRAHFIPFPSESAALSLSPSKASSIPLSGTWKFHLSANPFEAPSIEDVSKDQSGWTDIDVPSMWQLRGHGKGPHYTNTQYPFAVDPPYPPHLDNETGTYHRKFTIPSSYTSTGEDKDSNNQYRLRFEGVDSAFHVYVNGKEVGYSQGSRNPSEFDVTKYLDLQEGKEQEIAVRVYQWCDGSYIEDQVSALV